MPLSKQTIEASHSEGLYYYILEAMPNNGWWNQIY